MNCAPAMNDSALQMRAFLRMAADLGVEIGGSGYTGRNVRLGDYYVRELERIGSEHRQVVRYEVVGTGRVETMARSRFDRQARAA